MKQKAQKYILLFQMRLGGLASSNYKAVIFFPWAIDYEGDAGFPPTTPTHNEFNHCCSSDSRYSKIKSVLIFTMRVKQKSSEHKLSTIKYQYRTDFLSEKQQMNQYGMFTF